MSSPLEKYALSIVTGVTAHLAFRTLEPRSIVVQTLLILAPPLLGALSPPPTPLLLALPLHILTLLVATALYRLAPWHPLARYPGPRLARLSRFWATKLYTTGEQHRVYHVLHERYGPVVRTGPNHVMVRDVEAVHAVLGARSVFRKGRRYNNLSPPGSRGSLLGQRDPVQHAARRKLWEPAFTPAARRGYVEMMHKRIQQLVDGLEMKKDSGEVVDLAAWCGFMTFDFMGDLAFNGAFNVLKAGADPTGILTRVSTGTKVQELMGTIEWVNEWYVALGPGRRFARAMFAQAETVLKTRIGGGAERRDLFYYLNTEDASSSPVTSDSGSEALNFATLVHEAALVIVAGSDTTATVLANALAFVIAKPEVRAKLVKELEEVGVTAGEVPQPDALVGCEWLNAIINEVLRLRPAVPNGVQRVLPRDAQPAVIGEGNWVIPPGTTVQIPFYSLHRDARYFAPEPDAFEPERWIKDSAFSRRAGFKLEREALVPFSYGPTNCVGKNLALEELRTALATLVARFEFEIDEKAGWTLEGYERESVDQFTMQRGVLPVRVSLRKRA